MTRYVHDVVVDRVVIVGAGTEGVSTSELRALVEGAIARELSTAALPAGRMMRAAVEVHVPAIAAGAGATLARAVGHGLVRALGGGSSRG